MWALALGCEWKGKDMDVVINKKVACHDAAGLINACDMMREKNSTKVRADVLYLNRRGYPCRRYRPCEIDFWDYGTGNRSFNVYGDGFVAEWVVSVLREHYGALGIFVGWWPYDTPRSGAVTHL